MNDNEVDPWSPLGLAALTILNRLQCERHLLELAEEKKERRDEKPEAGEASNGYIEESVARIERFERRASGIGQAPRRKRE